MNAKQLAALRTADPLVLGRRIKEARTARGLRQGEMAGNDASVTHVSRIEAGQRKPTPQILEAFATRLMMSVDELLSTPHSDVSDRVRLLIDYAELALENAEPVEAEKHASEALAALPLGHPLNRRAALLHSRAFEAQGRPAEAIAELEPLVAAGGLDALPAAIALCRCLRDSGDLFRSIEVGEASMRTMRDAELDGSDDAVQLVVTVAASHYEAGDVATAARLCREAVAAAEALGTPKAKAAAYWNASMVESHRGNVSGALPLARQALALLSEGRDSRNLARLRCLLGILEMRSEPPALDEALATLTQADDELRSSSASPVDIARNWVALARVHLMNGDPAAAERLAEEAVELLGDTAPLMEADARAILGQVAARNDHHKIAKGQFERAAAILTGIGADRTAAQLWYELGTCMEDLGMDTEARVAFKRAAASTGLSLPPGVRPRSEITVDQFLR